MITWLLIVLAVYLLVGIIITVWAILTDPYGAFILPFAPFLIIAYPYFWIRNFIYGMRK